MKVLVVEDEAMVAHAIEVLLLEHHYSVDIALDGLSALEMAEMYTYDLLLLDIGLPRLDGVSLCQQLRDQGVQTPILLLTGQAAAAHNRAIALNAGADDYVTKPFEAEELLARVRALRRRGDLKTQPILRWGVLWLDPGRLQVSYGNTLLHLTPKEYSLLELLLRHAPNIVSSYTILEQCWSALEAPGDEVVRTHIKELRKKLKAAGAPQDLIKTVHRQGYRLNPVYGEAAGAAQDESATALQAAELRAVNEELRQTLEQLQATQAELEQRNQELQTARDELEQRVAERTTELEANLEALERLRSLSTRFVPNGDLQALYDEILTTAMHLTGAASGMLQILDAATQELMLLASVGFDPTMTNHYARVRAGASLPCGRALVTGQRTFVEFDVPDSEDLYGDCRRHREAGFLAAQSTPLISRLGSPIGMVSTHWRTHHCPSDRELWFLDLLARQAADLLEQRQIQRALHHSQDSP